MTVHTLAFPNNTNTFLFERSLDERVVDVVHSFSGGKQTLVFCSSKRSTESLASLLNKKLGLKGRPYYGAALERLMAITDGNLKALAGRGFAYHHAGLPPDDRSAIEELYLTGNIHILCSTSTLAHGVNLPAHLVIIKGTNCWRGGGHGYEKLAKSEIIQMMGRAGRPGYDTNGVAVIMTSKNDEKHFESISLSADVVESNLPKTLTEGLIATITKFDLRTVFSSTVYFAVICSEITQSVISNMHEAVTWLKSTYFYVR